MFQLTNDETERVSYIKSRPEWVQLKTPLHFSRSAQCFAGMTASVKAETVASIGKAISAALGNWQPPVVVFCDHGEVRFSLSKKTGAQA
jgi:hypothetical protein